MGRLRILLLLLLAGWRVDWCFQKVRLQVVEIGAVRWAWSDVGGKEDGEKAENDLCQDGAAIIRNLIFV